MIKISLIMADGTEEIEALTTKDVLVRAGVICDIISVSKEVVNCSRGVKVVADKMVADFHTSDYDGIIIPGGMPGSTNIKNCEKVLNAIREYFNSGKLVAGICASPAVVLAHTGVTSGKKVTCYPLDTFVNQLNQAIYTKNSVEVDGNLITADGIKSAMDFSLAICKFLNVEPKF